MTKSYLYIFYILLLTAIVSMSSCKKPLSFSNDNLSFSADTVIFDTVFTTVGSTTKLFKIYNNDSKSLKIEQIELIGGANSPFRINVDGESGTMFADIEMDGNDSLFVFVEVTLDPNNGTNPMVIEDRIRFNTNGTDQYVELVAWGQDAYFHYSDFSIPNGGGLDINVGTWPNDKPHVILNTAFIDSATTLTIPAGTDIYLHKGAILYNYKGTLNIEGTFNAPVTFQGDRLEAYYDDIAGQYYGIYLQEALPCSINYAIIKNGTSGIHAYSEDPSNAGYTLNLSNTKILNCSSYGLFIYSGAKVIAENCVLAKNGIHSLIVAEGGDFNLNNCHLLGYGNGENNGAAVGISNYFTRPDENGIPTTYIGSINEGTISNSIIYGSGEQEVAIDTNNTGGPVLNFDFNNNHIRSLIVPTDNFYSNNTFNIDPLFYNIDGDDYRVWWEASSPIVDAGNAATTSTFDIEGYPRAGAIPDKGAYEFH